MDKPTLKQAAERATQALEALEKALDRNDQRAAGAALHELRRALDEIRAIAIES